MDALIKRRGPLALKLILLALMGMIVAHPLLQPAMLCGADFPGHLAHAVELDRLLSRGVWYPRWEPDFAFGYGYLTFNFYPPLPRYIAVAIHGLGLPLRDSVKATMALALMMAGPAMYLFARRVYGERAGVAAALAYTFAPYLVNNAMQRFAVGETLAMSLMPLVMWAFARLVAPPTNLLRNKIVVAALVYAALLLTHSLMTLLVTPLVIGYLFLVWWNSERSPTLIKQAGLAAILALGLAAFFWLPFLAEVGWVQMWRATILDLTGELLYPLNWIKLRDLLWPTTLWPDYRLGDPLVQRFLSAPQLLLAVAALATARRWSSPLPRAMTWLLALTLLVATSLITPTSRWLWDHVRPIQIIQFPWRLLAPASFSLALLAGAGFKSLGFKSRTTVVMANALLVAMLAAWTLPWVRPFTCNIEANPSLPYLLWVDRNHIGGGSGGEFLPRWVDEPPTSSPLEGDLLAGKPLDRLDRADLPEGAQARLLSSQPLESQWEVASPRQFMASFNNFYFPGWSVRVDDQPASIKPAASSGLIEAEIPAGKHVVSLRLEPTTTQTIGSLVSLVSVLALLALQISNAKRQASGAATQSAIPGGTSVSPNVANGSEPPTWEWGAVAVMGAVVLSVRLVLATAAPTGMELPPGASSKSIQLGEQAQLVGYEFSQAPASGTLTVTLYWQTEQLLLTSYKSFVHVTDANGNLVAQSDAVPANWTRPTTAWLPGELVIDPHSLQLPTTPEPLKVWAGMYDPATSQRLQVMGNDSGRVRLGTLP